MASDMKPARDWILWIDCLGGLIVGLLVLLIHPFLSRIQGLPKLTIIFIGIANLAYGSYSQFVTTRKRRTIGLVKMLALANMAWLFVCLGILILWFNVLTMIGIVMVVGEGIYVATLGLTEWKWRTDLTLQPGKIRG
jgi:hypothetical protein